MNNDGGLGQYLLPGGETSPKNDDFGGVAVSQKQDDDNLVVSQLLQEMNNIKETQKQYGFPAIGDLFKARPQDIQETINSLYYMIKQRMQDQDAKTDMRQKLNRVESAAKDSKTQLERAQQKIEQMTKDNVNLKNEIKSLEQKHKQEIEKLTKERDELIKSMTKIEHKETQYKHEIRSREMQVTKLQEQLKAKMFDPKKAGKENAQPNGDGIVQSAKILPSNEVKFSKMSGESDLDLMINKQNQEIQARITQENHDLKDCLKGLQKEMFDIVKLKSDIYMKRFKAENYNTNEQHAFSSEEILKHELDKIKESLFSLPFDETSKDIIHKFRMNFQKLKQFMEQIDKSMGDLQVFNQKAASEPIMEDEKGMTSVVQLRELLRNYEGIVESQHSLLQTSITKMDAIPPPDEIAANFERFQILKDEELDDMRNFLNEHKQIMQSQYNDFEVEKRQFEEMNHRMEDEKQKVITEREKIEHEIRSIKMLNEDLYRQTGLQQ